MYKFFDDFLNRQKWVPYVEQSSVVKVKNTKLILDSYLASLHDYHFIIANNGVDPMSDGQDGAFGKGFANCRLDQVVGLEIDRCCCLIQKKDFVPSEVKDKVVV